MDEETKAAFGAELAALCRKFNVSVCSDADPEDDTDLKDWTEVRRRVNREWERVRRREKREWERAKESHEEYCKIHEAMFFGDLGKDNEVQRKQLEAAKLADDLRKSVRLREYFGLPMEGTVSLQAVSRRADNGYPAIVECRVKLDGTVKRVVPLRRRIDRNKLPEDVMAILSECMRSKPRD